MIISSDLAQLFHILDEIASIVRELVEDTPLHEISPPAALRVKKLSDDIFAATKSSESDTTEIIAELRELAIDAILCGNEIARCDTAALQIAGDRLSAHGADLTKAIEKADKVIRGANNPLRFGIAQGKASNDEKLRQERQQQADDLKRVMRQCEVAVSELREQLGELKQVAQVEIDKITQAYSDAQADITAKTDDINRVTGQAAARMIAGDYEGSAAMEKETADNLRLGALACMLLIVGVLGWAVLESTIATFEWERFLSKVSLVFLLGVPATYLARESAKHREQQYHHLQTSLDMKAISPFLASLPDEAQHKLKADIASRIFGGRDFSKVSNDPYPLNTHEIIMKLIDKVDFSNKPEKAKKVKPAEGASAAPAEAANQ